MIQVIVADAVVRRALIALLTPWNPAREEPLSATQTDNTPPTLIISDQPQPGQDIPVLVLGGEGLALPVRAADVLARVRHLLQQQSGAPEALTAREGELLAALAAAAPAPVTRESLLQQVWRYDPQAETHTIETHIYRLRQKLEAEGDTRRIVTVPGGYKLALLPCGAS